MEAKWDDVRDGAKRFVDNLTREAGHACDIAALKIKLESTKHKLDGEYTVLGKLTYQKLRRGDNNAEKIEASLSRIEALRRKIAALRAQIDAENEAHARQKEAEDTDATEESAIVVEPIDETDAE